VLKISNELILPREAVTWVFSYLAKRGAGKTYNASVQAEEMLKAGMPIVVIDGMGTWWGLRVSSDGKSKGLPVVVFGGEHADLPLNPEKAGEMARAIVMSNISCVLDLSGYAKFTARKIVANFLNELYKLNRVERHVFIEEADLWAPQRPIGQEEMLCLSAVDNFVRRGGNHNLGVTLITQRSAVLNKDILTQSDCLVILRTLAPQDKKAIQAWVEEQTDKDKTALKEWYDSLKSLENGEAYVWHPERPPIFQKVKYRQRETFHATREFIRSPQVANIVLMDVQEFVQKFKKVFEAKIEPPAPIVVTKEVKSKPVPIRKIEKPKIIMQSPPVNYDRVEVLQSMPNINIKQLKPTLTVPVETLDEPTTPLGKVAIVLKNDALNRGRQDKWTINRIKQHIRNHAWDDEGADEAIQQLVRWEILRKQSNNYMQFYPERVQLQQEEVLLETS
jgi:hypothetical protein